MTLIYEPEGCQKVMFLEFWIAIDIIITYILTLRLSSSSDYNKINVVRIAMTVIENIKFLFKNKVYKKHMFNDTVDQKWFYVFSR